MTLLATPALVRAKLGDVLRLYPDPRVVALSASPSWPYEQELDLPGGRRAIVRPCVSSLAVRDELSRIAELRAGDVLVLLTDREARDLGESITARLTPPKVLPLDRWQQLTSLFRARGIDPGLVAATWAVDALLADPPADGYPVVQTGYLDRETAFVNLARTAVGLDRLDLDLTGILEWSRDSSHVVAWRALTPPLRDGLAGWITGRVARPEVMAAVLRCLGGDAGPDTVAAGLVLAALAHPDSRGGAQVPRTLFESRVVAGALDPDVAYEWGRVAEGLVRRHLAAGGRDKAAPLLARAEALLGEQGASELARFSSVIEAGYVGRLRRVAGRLGLVTAGRAGGSELSALEAALVDLQSHALAADHTERSRRAEMAVRLARWLCAQRAASPAPAASLAEAARRQEQTDAWVDVARARVWEGDVDAGVGAAYSALCQSVDSLRAVQEERFARLLADHTATGSTLAELLPVEDFLSVVLTPLQSGSRVLLIVLDGMSTGVARELLADVTRFGWIEHTLTPPRPVISVLPSITRVSRTSLLTGKLGDGGQPEEKAAFAERGWAMFHKADLAAGGAGEPVSAAVATAVRGPSSVVGVVVNTVDDALDKGGRSPWTADSVDRLPDLLTLAQDADRVVILVSDHGHVHERGSRLESDDSGGARFRFSSRPTGPDEVELTGPRVLLGTGRVVAAWNERLRYAKTRNGYHGGASPQEVVIPLALLGRGELQIPGWAPRYHPEPAWWVEEAAATTAAPVAARPTRDKNRPKAPEAPAEHSPFLFGDEELAPRSWIDALLDSEVVVSQLRRRGVMPADRLAVLVRALDARNGVAPRGHIARALDVPEGRLAAQIAAAQRVLNIDGYDVLQMDGEHIRLNVALLKTQAGLR